MFLLRDAFLFNVPALGITHPVAVAPLPYGAHGSKYADPPYADTPIRFSYGPSFLEIAS